MVFLEVRDLGCSRRRFALLGFGFGAWGLGCPVCGLGPGIGAWGQSSIPVDYIRDHGT